MWIDFLPEVLSPQVALFLSAIALGLVFGFAAQRTRFCLRSAILEPRSSMPALWSVALGSAALGMAAIQFTQFADLSEHRLFAAEVPIVGLIVGGALFGIGMILTRGCASRLTVLGATGNLRALTVLFCFSIVAHSTIKGVLSEARANLNDYTVLLPRLDTLEAAWLGYGILLLLPLYLVAKSNIRTSRFLYAVLIGLLVPASWLLTSTLLADPFEVVDIQAVSFARPLTDSLFYIMVSSALELGFGHGWIIGVIVGAFVAAALFRELQWQSFSSPPEMLRYLAGGALMGFGAATAGGCTIGAVLAGLPALSVSALIVLVSIIAGAKGAQAIIQAVPVSGALPNRQSQLPAE